MTNTEIEKTMPDTPQLTCSICGDPIPVDAKGWSGGHNAEPINDGRCCSKCNMSVVVPARIHEMQARKRK